MRAARGGESASFPAVPSGSCQGMPRVPHVGEGMERVKTENWQRVLLPKASLSSAVTCAFSLDGASFS